MSLDFITAHLNLILELAAVFGVLTGLIVLGGFLLARFDGLPLHDGLYFAFTTALTVGFGDLTPKSHGARVVAIGLAFTGLLLLGILVAVAVHALDVALPAS